jgi:hypothetical protein
VQTERTLSSRLALGAITGLGLLLAIAGTSAPRKGASPRLLAVPLSLQLPGWLVVAAVTALTAASLLFLVLVFARPRTRRKTGEEHIEYSEPRKLNPVAAVLLIVLALTPAGILGGAIFWFHRSGGNAHEALAISPRLHSLALSHPSPAPSGPPTARPVRPAPPLTNGLLDILALLIGFGTLGFMLWLWLGDRLLRRGAEMPEAFRSLVAAAVDDSFDDLRLEPDARAAIIKTYRHFERALAAVELPRQPWQTPTEFMRAALRRLPLPETAVADLTRLFERARFSRHALGAAERDAAWRALGAIRAAAPAAEARCRVAPIEGVRRTPLRDRRASRRPGAGHCGRLVGPDRLRYRPVVERCGGQCRDGRPLRSRPAFAVRPERIRAALPWGKDHRHGDAAADRLLRRARCYRLGDDGAADRVRLVAVTNYREPDRGRRRRPRRGHRLCRRAACGHCSGGTGRWLG